MDHLASQQLNDSDLLAWLWSQVNSEEIMSYVKATLMAPFKISKKGESPMIMGQNCLHTGKTNILNAHLQTSFIKS